MRTWLFSTVLLVGVASAQAPEVQEPRPLDFTKVDRTPPVLPAADAHRTYGIYLFGRNGEHRVWAVLEASGAGAAPSALWLDLDGDGALVESERFVGKAEARPRIEGEAPAVKFTVGDFRPPGSDATHKDFTITWTPKIGVRFRMLWHGKKVSFGGYGPSHDTYAAFARSPQDAPVFVPGHDRPFEFERWIADPLRRGADTDFKVFVGNRGDRVGAFAAVDEDFLPAGEFVVATLHYRDAAGKPATARFELRQRC